jgi:hypothetical protein
MLHLIWDECETYLMLSDEHGVRVLNLSSFIGFEVLTAVVMKSIIFWDITSCNPLKVNRRFGGTYRLHMLGRISRGRYQRESR